MPETYHASADDVVCLSVSIQHEQFADVVPIIMVEGSFDLFNK
jgi:hypothetical protein